MRALTATAAARRAYTYSCLWISTHISACVLRHIHVLRRPEYLLAQQVVLPPVLTAYYSPRTTHYSLLRHCSPLTTPRCFRLYKSTKRGKRRPDGTPAQL